MSFFKDYRKFCKDNVAFYKKHWFAMLCISVVTTGATISLAIPKEVRKDIVDDIKNKFRRGDEES